MITIYFFFHIMRAYRYKHNLKGTEIAEKMLSVMETVVMFITMADTRYKCEMHYIFLFEPLHFPPLCYTKFGRSKIGVSNHFLILMGLAERQITVHKLSDL